MSLDEPARHDEIALALVEGERVGEVARTAGVVSRYLENVRTGKQRFGVQVEGVCLGG